MAQAVKGVEGDGAFRAVPQAGAFVLLTGGLTMVFLAAATISSRPALAWPALAAPGVVGMGLALQRRLDLTALLGPRFRLDLAAAALATGPFIVVLSMVATGMPRQLTVSDQGTFAFRVLGAAVAEVGWWGYLYPTIRALIPPFPSAGVVALAWVGWHGLLAWAGANPLAGASPVLLVAWALGAAMTASAILEFRPQSVVPVSAFQFGLAAAIVGLRFSPASAGTPVPMMFGAGLLALCGLMVMARARHEAVGRARHAPAAHS